MLNGVAEALKHGLTQSRELTDAIVEPLRNGDPAEVLHDGAYLENVCRAALEIKAPTLDNYDASDYNEFCPQYGHAVGHAVEHTSWSGKAHSPLLHGEAVAIGMCVSAEVAKLKGICTDKVVDEHYDIVKATGLPCYVPPSMTAETVIRQMRFDKHTVKVPTMGLCAEVGGMALFNGETYAFEVSEEELVAAIDANVARREADDTCVVCAPAPVELEINESPSCSENLAEVLRNSGADQATAGRAAAAIAERVRAAKASAEIVDLMGPPLHFIKYMDFDALQQYRRDYLRYRSGAPTGSRDRLVAHTTAAAS
mmetsp:Transcript_9921/g.33657  ORF Transcript_9921/g.33657 Transcript_9921/m.33657 type:complete len:312 (+) Transcript_9921:1652-2587(+)